MAELDSLVSGTVTFELVSPERILISEPVEMVVIPGAEGDFGVLPGHSPLISSIRPGTIRVYTGSAITQSIFVESGFAEVTPERCTVLADNAINVSDFDRDALVAELTRATAEQAVGAASGDAFAQKHLETALRIAAAKLYALDNEQPADKALAAL